MERNSFFWMRITLLLLLAVSAFYGALNLIFYPDGQSLGLSVELLKNSGFSDFLIPGFVLLLFMGVLPIVIAVLSIQKIHNYSFWISLQGVILIIWLCIQLLINNKFFHPLMHSLYFLIGFLLLSSDLQTKKIHEIKAVKRKR